MTEPDPVSWIREIGLDVPWEHDLLGAFVRAYLRTGRRGRERARAALPSLEREVASYLALRAPERRN